jgi:hypothetical protein
MPIETRALVWIGAVPSVNSVSELRALCGQRFGSLECEICRLERLENSKDDAGVVPPLRSSFASANRLTACHCEPRPPGAAIQLEFCWITMALRFSQ